MFPDRPMKDFSVITIAFRTVCLVAPEEMNDRAEVYYVETPCTKTTVLTAPTDGYDSDDIYSKGDQKSCNDGCHRQPGNEVDRGSVQGADHYDSQKDGHKAGQKDGLKEGHKADLDGSNHGTNHRVDHNADHQTDNIRPQITEAFGSEDVVTAMATVYWPRKAAYGLVAVFPVVLIGVWI